MKMWRVINPRLKCCGLLGVEMKTWTPPLVRCCVSKKLVQLEFGDGTKRWLDIKNLERSGDA